MQVQSCLIKWCALEFSGPIKLVDIQKSLCQITIEHRQQRCCCHTAEKSCRILEIKWPHPFTGLIRLIQVPKCHFSSTWKNVGISFLNCSSMDCESYWTYYFCKLLSSFWRYRRFVDAFEWHRSWNKSIRIGRLQFELHTRHLRNQSKKTRCSKPHWWRAQSPLWIKWPKCMQRSRFFGKVLLIRWPGTWKTMS